MNFEKFQLKWKIVKHFTRPKQRAALRKLFSLHQPPIPPDKILLNLWNKNFLREICRNIHIFAFNVLQESSSWASGNGTMQMIFLTPNRNIFVGKFVNWESMLFPFSKELRFVKWVRFFERSCIVKWVIFLTGFYWLWDFLL